jgi:hypothetical protein
MTVVEDGVAMLLSLTGNFRFGLRFGAVSVDTSSFIQRGMMTHTVAWRATWCSSATQS